MKWVFTFIYILSALFVTGCTSAVDTPQTANTLDVTTEHPLTIQVRELSQQLLQQPYFVQGSFKYGQLLYIKLPTTTVTLPVSHHQLQRASADIFSQPAWFDIQILTEQVLKDSSEQSNSGYSLAIYIAKIKETKNQHTVAIELINNRFNTVEAHVDSIIYL